MRDHGQGRVLYSIFGSKDEYSVSRSLAQKTESNSHPGIVIADVVVFVCTLVS